MADQLYATATGCTNIISINVSDSHSAPTATATIVAENCSLDVGDFVTVNMGYTTAHQVVFKGYVKNVQHSQQPDQYEVSCANVMIRAMDFFIASTNPEEPYSKHNIKAEDVVQDLMAMAGLTNYTSQNTFFIFATGEQALEVNLVSAYDFSKFIADVLAFHLYADIDGQVHFIRRMPFPDGDSASRTINSSDIITVGHFKSDRDLRNRVVVYGAEGIFAEAKESSPYLPAGFYKTVAVAAPTVITTQSMAQQSADYNLDKLNRLTLGGTISMIGDASLTARDCVTVNKSDIGMTGLWYIYGCEHDISKEGFTTNLDLRQ